MEAFLLIWTTGLIFFFFSFSCRHNEIKEQFAVVMTEWKDQSEANRENANDGMTGEDSVPLLHSNTIATLEGYFTTMDFLYRDDMKYRDDYR